MTAEVPAAPAAVDLFGIGKAYPGEPKSLRGTKLEVKGPVLWVRNLLPLFHLTSESVPSVTALSGVDLRVRPGEILALIGENGSGKTTLLRIVAGLLAPSSGHGTVMGAPLTDGDAVRSRVAYLATNAWMSLEWPLTAEQNVRYYGVLSGLSGREALARAEAALRAVSMWEDRQKYPLELSNGMRQRVALARILLTRAPLVLLDEPTVGLDPENAEELLRLVREDLRAEGRAVVLTGHLTAQLESVAQRAMVLREGRIVAEGTPLELTRSLGGHLALEVEIEEGMGPIAPAPDGIRLLRRTERPGPLPSVNHRLLVRRGDASVDGALDWLTEGGRAPGRVVYVGAFEPTLEDAVQELLHGQETGS